MRQAPRPRATRVWSARMPTLSLPDLDLWYERHGEGRPILLCNGSGATIATSMPLVQMLARHGEVLVHDQRCLGRTGLPATQPTMADYAADAIALLDHVGWQTAAVFGISFGGMVAQELAVTVPHRIERLVLQCTSPGGAGGSSYPLHELAGMDPDERARVSLHNLDTRFDLGGQNHTTFDVLAVGLVHRPGGETHLSETRLGLGQRNPDDPVGQRNRWRPT